MSQESSCSTVPFELSQGQDSSFVEELSIVNDLYFQNFNVDSRHSVVNYDSEIAYSDSDPESDVNDESDVDDNYVSSNREQFDLYIEPSEHDIKELAKQEKFKSETCGCAIYYDGNPCSKIIDFKSMIDFRHNCAELSKDELDLIIKASLCNFRQSGDTTSSCKHKTTERIKPSQQYYFKGKHICRSTFCFIHAIDKQKLQVIGRSLDNDGLKPRVHGLAGRKPSNSLTVHEQTYIYSFLKQYATDNALPLPGRLPNFKHAQVLLLPSDKRQADIHEIYVKAASESAIRSASLSTFIRTWKDLCPNIVLSKPSTDLCHQCQMLSFKISNTWDAMHLKRHIRHVHEKIRNFECDICKEKFFRSDHLKSHRQRHFEPGLKCKFCPRKFKLLMDLERHTYRHTGENRWFCHLCTGNQGFKYPLPYYNHMMKTHGIEREEASVFRKLLIEKEKLKKGTQTKQQEAKEQNTAETKAKHTITETDKRVSTAMDKSSKTDPANIDGQKILEVKRYTSTIGKNYKRNVSKKPGNSNKNNDNDEDVISDVNETEQNGDSEKSRTSPQSVEVFYAHSAFSDVSNTDQILKFIDQQSFVSSIGNTDSRGVVNTEFDGDTNYQGLHIVSMEETVTADLGMMPELDGEDMQAVMFIDDNDCTAEVVIDQVSTL